MMSYHQVMPVYLDFMVAFGARSDRRDLRFSGFRQQIQLKVPQSGHLVPELGRSGKTSQMCYNLKAVQLRSKSSEDIELDDWSIQNAAFYHQFDVEYGTTLWIVTKSGMDVLDRYKDLAGQEASQEALAFQDLEPCFRLSLHVHPLFSHWSTEDWRRYIRWLEVILDQQVRTSVFITVLR
jgi:hypothetical protein